MVEVRKILNAKEVPVVIRADEVGFFGARRQADMLRVVGELQEREVQVKLHLLGDTKQMQAISAGDFLHQVETLGKRDELEFAHLTEILRQRNPNSSTLNKEAEPARNRELPEKVPGPRQPAGVLAVKIRELGRSVLGPGKSVPRLALESIRVPKLSTPARQLIKLPTVTATLQKEVGRQLELTLAGKFGWSGRSEAGDAGYAHGAVDAVVGVEREEEIRAWRSCYG